MAKKPEPATDHPDLNFPEKIPTKPPAPQLDKRLPGNPVWTERKANIIKLYIDLFVFVVGRGIYIDAFAGHQYVSHQSYWAAHLVWNSNPGKKFRRIVRFELFEKNSSSFASLKTMVDSIPHDGREVYCVPGDTNINLPEALAKRPITKPAFCLLDQRTTECSWNLVKNVASHKNDGTKIEIFYFLMASWKDRSIKNRDKSRDGELLEWWGRDDYEDVFAATPQVLAERFVERFKKELGYQFVRSYPIAGNESAGGPGKIHYYMIHATDHPAAPDFMLRAYNRVAGGYDPTTAQEAFEWSTDDLEKISSLYKHKGRIKVRKKRH